MKIKTKYYQHTFEQLIFRNRWKIPFYSRPSDWVFIGISTRWFSCDQYCYKISFFGLELEFWFKKTSLIYK